MVGAIKGAWPSLHLDDYGIQAWRNFLLGQDYEVTMLAYVRLSERQREIPTIADLRHMILAVEADRRAKEPSPPEVEFVRDLPNWVKGWAVARFRHRDLRVWPQQKPGFDAQQTEHSSTRSHIWGDQEPMPADLREAYETEGSQMTAADIAMMIDGSLP
jgi:hypothetical protein